MAAALGTNLDASLCEQDEYHDALCPEELEELWQLEEKGKCIDYKIYNNKHCYKIYQYLLIISHFGDLLDEIFSHVCTRQIKN